MSLSLTLHHVIVDIYGVKKITAADTIAKVIGKCDCAVHKWRKVFYENAGSFPDSEQGHYQREGVLWCDEKLAHNYVRRNAVVKGKPNMTSLSFTRWVNNELLPNNILEPGFPRHIGVEMGCKFLHELGFEVLDKKKDGHEREYVVEYRGKCLCFLIAGGFLSKDDAPTDEVKKAFPNNIQFPPPECQSKHFFIFHDEFTFIKMMMNLYNGGPMSLN